MSELIITRTFDVPRELVFKSFTEPEHLKEWWGGTRESKISITTFDFQPGGKFVYSSQHGDMQMVGIFVYESIESPAKLTFISGFADSDGNFTRAPFAEHFPLKVHNTWTFEETAENITTLTIRGGVHDGSKEEIDFFTGMLEGMTQGFNGCLDQLQEHLEAILTGKASSSSAIEKPTSSEQLIEKTPDDESSLKKRGIEEISAEVSGEASV